MINIEEYPILNHVVTLKRASKDENGDRIEYMTESQADVINFDKVKEALHEQLEDFRNNIRMGRIEEFLFKENN